MGKKSNLKKRKREGIKKENFDKVDNKIQEKSEKPPIQKQENESVTRMVVIETDGNNIHVVKNTTSGNLELISMLQVLLTKITSPK